MKSNYLQLYLDNVLTTKVDSRVLDAIIPYFTEIYGNASSNHNFCKNQNKQLSYLENKFRN